MENIKQNYEKFEKEILPFLYYKKDLARIIYISIIINWHMLIEDLPWAWKTSLSKAIANLIWYDFARIQWTSDLLAQDIIWWEIYDFETKSIKIKRWAIFSDLILVDEINRMHPKTQSAFLQAMEEKKVSIAWESFKLHDNFLIIATQNPIENEWTYPLPEAQRDRFYAKISLGRPDRDIQKEIIVNNVHKQIESKIENLKILLNKDDISKIKNQVEEVKVSPEIADKLIDFFEEVNKSSNFIYPISQRAISIFLRACKANALIEERDYIKPKDWKILVKNFLLHRLVNDNSWLEILEDIYDNSFKRF